MANDCTSLVIEHLQDHTFTAASDGRHESDYKLYPIVVNCFNADIGCIENTFGYSNFGWKFHRSKFFLILNVFGNF